jgi:outer membrane protein assembly factor BamE (lipoprotein component of BamABCDE complex)
MKRHYALIAIMIVAGCSNQSDNQSITSNADDKQRIAELEAELADAVAWITEAREVFAEMEAQEQASAATPEPKVWTQEELKRTIKRGMTKADVKAILGPPNTTNDFEDIDGTYHYNYRNLVLNTDTERTDHFTIEFLNGNFNKFDW